MMKETMTCNEKSEGCLMLFGVNILAKNPIRDGVPKCSSMLNRSYCHGEEEINANKENSEGGYLSDVLVQQRHNFHDKKNKGTFAYISFDPSIDITYILKLFTFIDYLFMIAILRIHLHIYIYTKVVAQ